MSVSPSGSAKDRSNLTDLTRARERELVIMLVEDDDGDALLVEELLRDGLPEAQLVRASTIEEALRDLDGSVSCVLLDLGLPDSSGMDGVRQLHERRGSVAIVVLTGANDQTLGIRAVGQGAQDYLVKGQADDQVLARSILYAVERQRSEEVGRRLFEVERQRLENARMERALLPHPVVSSDDLTLSVAYRPGNEGAELGGDFYDAVELADGALRVVIGDVSGHGPDEAALGAALRSSWRALVLAGLATSDVLGTLDRQLRTERPDACAFVTLCMLEIDPTHRQAAVTLAGHPAPFVLGTTAERLPEHVRGPLLGIVGEPRWPSMALDLPTEWSIMLYTDGLIEGLDGGGMDGLDGPRHRVGEQGVLDILATRLARGVRGSDLVQATIAEVEARNGGPLTDDLAVCLVEGRWR
jgi:serine phosphatase RsbU (regulator of sigma subunit)